eukprot:3171611-Rhodomonas_salina.1
MSPGQVTLCPGDHDRDTRRRHDVSTERDRTRTPRNDDDDASLMNRGSHVEGERQSNTRNRNFTNLSGMRFLRVAFDFGRRRGHSESRPKGWRSAKLLGRARVRAALPEESLLPAAEAAPIEEHGQQTRHTTTSSEGASSFILPLVHSSSSSRYAVAGAGPAAPPPPRYALASRAGGGRVEGLQVSAPEPPRSRRQSGPGQVPRPISFAPYTPCPALT